MALSRLHTSAKAADVDKTFTIEQMPDEHPAPHCNPNSHPIIIVT